MHNQTLHTQLIRGKAYFLVGKNMNLMRNRRKKAKKYSVVVHIKRTALVLGMCGMCNAHSVVVTGIRRSSG